MLNAKSCAAVDSARIDADTVMPLYDSYCFANIPHTVAEILSGTRGKGGLPEDVLPGLKREYDQVVLFMVDAFGWRFMEQFKDAVPLLGRLCQDGTVSKLTAQFPSTTTAELTSLHTGLRVGESGVFEWNYYEPKLDKMISPLPFRPSGTKGSDSLVPLLEQRGLGPHDILPGSQLYPGLGLAGADAMVFQSEKVGKTGWDRVILEHAPIVPYLSLEDGLDKLLEQVRSKPRGYFVYYHGEIDSILHKYGPGSTEAERAVHHFFEKLESRFFNPLLASAQKPLLLLTADHGQINMDPQKTVYLDRVMPGIEGYLRRNQEGEVLAPGGSCRDMFLYVLPGKIEELERLLTSSLSGIADVRTVESVISQGYFGTASPSAEFRARAGDIAILPKPGESVFWYGGGAFEQKDLGSHGGLTRAEMEIPLIALET